MLLCGSYQSKVVSPGLALLPFSHEQDGIRMSPLLAGQGSGSCQHSSLPLRLLANLGIYLLCPLKGLGGKLGGCVPRQNSHLFFSHLEPFTYFYLFSGFF